MRRGLGGERREGGHLAQTVAESVKRNRETETQITRVRVLSEFLARGGAVAARRSHTPQAVGSIPTPAIWQPYGHQKKSNCFVT